MKYRIKIREQYFDFDSHGSAKLRALELLHQGCWWFTLETVKEEKEQVKPKQKETKQRGKKR